MRGTGVIFTNKLGQQRALMDSQPTLQPFCITCLQGATVLPRKETRGGGLRHPPSPPASLIFTHNSPAKAGWARGWPACPSQGEGCPSLLSCGLCWNVHWHPGFYKACRGAPSPMLSSGVAKWHLWCNTKSMHRTHFPSPRSFYEGTLKRFSAQQAQIVLLKSPG